MARRPETDPARGPDGADGKWGESHRVAPAVCIVNPSNCTHTIVLTAVLDGGLRRVQLPLAAWPPQLRSPDTINVRAASEGATSRPRPASARPRIRWHGPWTQDRAGKVLRLGSAAPPSRSLRGGPLLDAEARAGLTARARSSRPRTARARRPSAGRGLSDRRRLACSCAGRGGGWQGRARGVTSARLLVLWSPRAVGRYSAPRGNLALRLTCRPICGRGQVRASQYASVPAAIAARCSSIQTEAALCRRCMQPGVRLGRPPRT
jgi:hypothetical protein